MRNRHQALSLKLHSRLNNRPHSNLSKCLSSSLNSRFKLLYLIWLHRWQCRKWECRGCKRYKGYKECRVYKVYKICKECKDYKACSKRCKVCSKVTCMGMMVHRECFLT